MEGSEPSTDATLSLSDAELIARHVGGDADAFGELVRRHRDRLWAVALRTLGDREEAADALQDALVSAFRSAHTFQGRSAVTTWLHRIVVNACLDRARRSASRRTTPLEEEGRGFDALLGTDEAADAPVVRSELRHELAAALAALPAEQRSALVLVDMQAYPVAEAAEMLGVPVGTVKSRCARGRARLLPMLKHLRAAQGDGPQAVSRETVLDVSRETSPQPKAPLQDTRRRAGSGNLPAGGTVPGRSPALPTGDMAGEMTAGGGAAPA